MTNKRTTHAELFEETRRRLSKRGQAVPQFVSGSTTAFSGQPLPDLIFVPERGANAGFVHLLELKVTQAEEAPDILVLAGISAAAAAIQANPGVDMRAAVAISAPATERQVQVAIANGVTLLSNFDGAGELANLVERWAGADVLPTSEVINFLESKGMLPHPGGELRSGRLWRLGKLRGGPVIYVDYRPDFPIDAVRPTEDGDIVIDRNAKPQNIEHLWVNSYNEALRLVSHKKN